MGYSVRYQILPLDKEMFDNQDIETLQQEFFEDDLIESADEYGCSYLAFEIQELPLHEDEVVYLLFQYDSKIVASGLLIDVDAFDEPDEDGFTGVYVFISSAIATFEPVELAEFQTIFPETKSFSDEPQEFDGTKLDAFVKLVRPRLRNLEPEEFTPEEWIREQLEAMAEEVEE